MDGGPSCLHAQRVSTTELRLGSTCALRARSCHCWLASLRAQDHYCEVVTRVLEKIFHSSRSSGRAVPQHLVLVADNTTAQAKNQNTLLYLCFLVAHKYFATICLFHLMVGHTHEDVDQLLP